MTSTRVTDALRRVLESAPSEDDFTSPVRDPRLTVRVGVWLGVCFGIALVTGVWSHIAQVPTPWLPLPTTPAWLYRVTQGVHIATGTAAVPLLLVKMWSVYPKLFRRPPALPRARFLDLAERGSIAVLVGSAFFQLATGLANAAQWYPWSFDFRGTHFAVAWVAVGAMLVHIGVKLPIITGRDSPAPPAPHEASASSRSSAPADATGSGPSRRALLGATWGAAGVVVLATATSGVPSLRRLSVLAVRSGTGPGGIPINRSAAAAHVERTATDPAYRLRVVGPDGEVRLGLHDLAAMPQVSATLPIACVEGWSASGTWSGVRVRDVVALVGRRPGMTVGVVSLQQAGGSRVSTLPANVVDDPRTLLALRLGDEALDLDHGYPCRVIAPNRPGALQTKWVAHLEVSA